MLFRAVSSSEDRSTVSIWLANSWIHWKTSTQHTVELVERLLVRLCETLKYILHIHTHTHQYQCDATTLTHWSVDQQLYLPSMNYNMVKLIFEQSQPTLVMASLPQIILPTMSTKTENAAPSLPTLIRKSLFWTFPKHYQSNSASLYSISSFLFWICMHWHHFRWGEKAKGKVMW